MKTTTALLLSISLLPLPAFADATLDDVISRFEAEATRDGNVATFPKIVLEKKDSSITLTDVRAEEANGTVTLSTPSDIVIQFKSPEFSGDPQGLTETASSESSENENHEVIIRAPDAKVTLTDITDLRVAGDLNVQSAQILSDEGGTTADARITGLTSVFNVTRENGSDSHVSFKQESVTYDVTEETGQSSGTLGPMEGEIRLTAPAQPIDGYDTPFAAIRDGLRFSLSLSGDGAEQSVKAEGHEMSASSAPWAVMADMNDGGIGLSATGEGGDFVMTSEGGKGYEYGAYELRLMAPSFVEGSDEFRVHMKSDDIAPNDAAWDSVDKNKDLDRSPLNINVDVSGTFIENAEAAFAPGTPPSNLFKDVKINAFDISGMGASIVGSGDLTIDPLTSMPQNGSALFNLSGVNGLIEGLISAGIVTEQHVAPMRMSLAMIAKPKGDAQNDEAVINLKVDEGRVSLNGSPMN